MNTTELISECTDLMHEYGVDSQEVIDFIRRNQANCEFVELVQISRILKRVLDKDLFWQQELKRLTDMIKPSYPSTWKEDVEGWCSHGSGKPFHARGSGFMERDLRADWEEMAPDLVLDEPELKTWRITQIIYLGGGKRHTDYWYVQTRREPTKAEVRERWGIKRDDAIVISQAPPVRVWDLPGEEYDG